MYEKLPNLNILFLRKHPVILRSEAEFTLSAEGGGYLQPVMPGLTGHLIPTRSQNQNRATNIIYPCARNDMGSPVEMKMTGVCSLY